jgi:hypothetical protein
MSNESTVTTTPVTSAPSANEGVDKSRSGNLSVGQAALQLLQRGAPENPTSSAEQATPPAPPESGETAPQPAPVEAEAPPDSFPEVNAPEDQPAETPGEPKDGTALSHELPPELQAKIDKRIGKEVARRKTLEEENARLKAQLSQPPTQSATPPPAPSPDEPLGHVTDVQALAQEHHNIKEVKRWAQAQLLREDGSESIEAYGRTWSRQDLQATVLNADRVLEDQIPARFQFLQARSQAEVNARQTFPWLNDPQSAEYAEYQAAFKQYPMLAKMPDAPFVVAVQITGRQALQKQQEAAAAAAKKKQTPPKPSSPPPGSQTAVGAAPAPIRETVQATAQKAADAAVQGAKVKGNLTQKDMARLLSQKAQSTR